MYENLDHLFSTDDTCLIYFGSSAVFDFPTYATRKQVAIQSSLRLQLHAKRSSGYHWKPFPKCYGNLRFACGEMAES